MSDTPRTDDQRIIARNLKWNIECVWEWAQQLERELAALREMARDFEDPDAQTAICDAADSLRKSADALKARVEQETQSAFLLRDEQNRRVAAQDELAEARRDTDFWRTAWSEKWDAQRVGAGQSAAAMQEGKT